MKTSRVLLSALLATVMGSAIAQTDAPGQNQTASVRPSAPAGGPGAVLSTFPTDPALSTPVGLEAIGGNTLLLSAITNGEFGRINADTGALTAPAIDLVGTPIGITTDGINIYHTDTTTGSLVTVSQAGAPISTADISAFSTFPEGITYVPASNSLYVVDGAGGNQVGQFSLAGALLNTFPILGSSPDGIAFDAASSTFWLYDSGTDTVRNYDLNFNQLSSFPGTIAAGFGGGEGVAVAGGSVFVVATGSATVVEFGVVPFVIEEYRMIPSTSVGGLALLALLLTALTAVVLKRRS